MRAVSLVTSQLTPESPGSPCGWPNSEPAAAEHREGVLQLRHQLVHVAAAELAHERLERVARLPARRTAGAEAGRAIRAAADPEPGPAAAADR